MKFKDLVFACVFMLNHMVQVVQQDDFPMLTKIRMPELTCFQIIFSGSWIERTKGFIQQGTEISNVQSLLLHSRECLSGWLHSQIFARAVRPQCFQLGHTATAESYLQSEKALVCLLDSCHSEIIS